MGAALVMLAADNGQLEWHASSAKTRSKKQPGQTTRTCAVSVGADDKAPTKEERGKLLKPEKHGTDEAEAAGHHCSGM